MSSSNIFLVALLLLNKGSVGRCKALAQDCSLTQTSFTLGGLDTKVMTVIVVIHFDLAATCKRKSLAGSLMCLDLSHFYSPSLRV